MIKNLTKGEKILISVFILFFFLVFLSEILNGRFWLNDFRVYFEAAKSMLNSQPVYGVSYGLSSGLYKYAPLGLLPIFPFTLLNFTIAAAIFYCLLCIAYGSMAIALPRVLRGYLKISELPKKYWITAFLGFVIIASFCHREIHLGNINIFLLAIAFIVWRNITKKPFFAGTLLAISILFKPHFIVLFLLCMIWRKWKVVTAASIGIIIGLILPAVWLGFSNNIELLSQWVQTMAGHSNNVTGSVNTIYYYPVKIYSALSANGGSERLVALLFVVISGVIGLVAHVFLYRKATRKNELFMYEFFVALAIIPILTVTDTEHFILSFPLVIYCLINWKKISIVGIKALLILGFFMYGGDWGDLMGEFNQIMGKYGLIGLGNLTIILCSLYIYIKNNLRVLAE